LVGPSKGEERQQARDDEILVFLFQNVK
jgi:hypothetical protein